MSNTHYRYEFVWDPNKAASNLQKHGVSFEEATTVFQDPFFVAFDNEEHGASRFIAIGTSSNARLLFVACVEVGDDTVRIISARKANAKNRSLYEEQE